MRLVPVPGVFRPISDSWLLARVVREEVRPGAKVLDVCTGSGVVGVTAAQAGAEVTAIDVSCRAVAAAWLNARINRVRVRPRRGSLLEAAPERLRPGGALLVVHSDLIGADETLERLAAAGLEADVAARERGPLGPLMRERVPAAVEEEEVLVLRGRRPD